MTLARVMASIADAQGRGHFQSEEVSLLSPNASVIDCLDVILNFGKDRLTARGSKSRESGCCWEYQLPKIDQRSWWLELDTRVRSLLTAQLTRMQRFTENRVCACFLHSTWSPARYMRRMAFLWWPCTDGKVKDNKSQVCFPTDLMVFKNVQHLWLICPHLAFLSFLCLSFF